MQTVTETYEDFNHGFFFGVCVVRSSIFALNRNPKNVMDKLN